ncbi:phosphohydrolase [Pseudomonas fluorescens]|nr:phosphohydrolase [Pseudomonas fluorescens]NKI51383.1 phosphohydrolase [Pseudomonas fluorescens]NKI63876.1 phosphohydrolase [Pseudomonas fluorescens]
MNLILTHTGKHFDLLEPNVDMIDPRDISHALAHLCSFNGHTREFYSVAQHSCTVAELVPEEHKLAALLHNAPEAYLGAMTRPLKQWMHTYHVLEEAVWQHVCKRFDIATALPSCIHLANLIALATERRDLMPSDPAIWDCLVGIEPMVETIRPWPAAEARNTYHQRLMDQLAIEHRRKAA